VSVTARKNLVSKEGGIFYRGHVLQQAGYQRISVLVAAGTLTQTNAFRSTSKYVTSFPIAGRLNTKFGSSPLPMREDENLTAISEPIV
jgi:hypothetical protein